MMKSRKKLPVTIAMENVIDAVTGANVIQFYSDRRNRHQRYKSVSTFSKSQAIKIVSMLNNWYPRVAQFSIREGNWCGRLSGLFNIVAKVPHQN